MATGGAKPSGANTAAQDQVAIRPARDTDLTQIQAIYAHHVLYGLASFEEKPPSLEEMASRRRALLELDYPYLVAECDGTVAGYAYASGYRPRPAYRYAVECSVYVAERQGRRGIGRSLLSALIALCEDRGLRRMVAVIGDSDNLPSIRLHEALGFRHAGTIRSVGFKHGRWVDSVIMERPLGAGDATLPDPAPEETGTRS